MGFHHIFTPLLLGLFALIISITEAGVLSEGPSTSTLQGMFTSGMSTLGMSTSGMSTSDMSTSGISTAGIFTSGVFTFISTTAPQMTTTITTNTTATTPIRAATSSTTSSSVASTTTTTTTTTATSTTTSEANATTLTPTPTTRTTTTTTSTTIEVTETQLYPVNASMSSVYLAGYYPASKCIDGITTDGDWGGGSGADGMCHTGKDLFPWIALDFGTQVMVKRVDIVNRSVLGDRTRNINIRVGDQLPASGEEMFTGGKLLGQFDGPATDGQYISIQGNGMLAGRYLIIQMDNGNDPLNLKEVTAYGRKI